MPTLCILGDSHLGAWRLGWEAGAAAFPEWTPVFFGAGRQRMEGLVVKNGGLVPDSRELQQRLEETSGGRPHIEDGFTHYVVSGLSCKPGSMAAALKLGKDERRAAGVAALEGTLALHTLAKLRCITQAPITMLPTPMSTVGSASLGGRSAKAHRRAKWMVRVFHAACVEAAARHGADFIPQPEETLFSPARTRPEFARGQVEGEEAGPSDASHMNPAFGAIVIRDLLCRLTAVAPMRAAA